MLPPTRFHNLHLLVSAVLIVIIAVVYGFAPAKLVPALSDFQIGNHNVQNFFKAVMGLYFGTAAYWLLGATRPAYWRGATVLNILLMFGLVAGRLLSIVLDGPPAPPMYIGLGLELLLGAWGLVSLRRYAPGNVATPTMQKQAAVTP
jgi:hypothetical protein